MDSRRVVEQLETSRFGRSVKYGFRRHVAVYQGDYERLLEKEPKTARDWAERGRALRLLGRRSDAEDCFGKALALDSKLARALAYRFEARLADAVKSRYVAFDDIDAAIALEPKDPWWRVWRAAAWLSGVATSSRRKGRLKALEDSAAAIKLDRGCALAWIVSAWANEMLTRPQAARQALSRALALEPGEGWLYVWRAELGGSPDWTQDDERGMLLDEGLPFGRFAPPDDPKAAVASTTRRLKRAPKSHWARVIRSSYLRGHPFNDFSGALRDLEEAAALAPRCAWTRAHLSRAQIMAGDLDAARRSLDAAVKLAPKSGWIRAWRGELRRRRGELEPALADFEAALRLDPSQELVYAWRGGARRALGDDRGALEDLDAAARLDARSAWVHHERCLALRGLGRVAEAISALEEACRLDGKFGWCRDRRDAAAATVELDAVLREQPRNAAAYAWRGEAKLGAGDPEGARQDLEACLALEPERAWARAWLGRALILLGRSRDALPELDRAVALDPRYPNALAWRGRARLDLGDAKRAVEDLGASVALEAKSAWALAWLAEAEAAAGGLEDAAADYRRSLELNPRDGKVWFQLAKVSDRLGRPVDTSDCLGAALREAARMRAEGRIADAEQLLKEIAAGAPRAALESLTAAAQKM